MHTHSSNYPFSYIFAKYFAFWRRDWNPLSNLKKHIIFTRLPSVERHFSMDFFFFFFFAFPQSWSLFKKKSIYSQFLCMENLRIFKWLFSLCLGGDVFISQDNKCRDGFPFTLRDICLHSTFKVSFLLLSLSLEERIDSYEQPYIRFRFS